MGFSIKLPAILFPFIIGGSVLLTKKIPASISFGLHESKVSTKEDGLILWNAETHLTWDDFQGTPDSTSSYKAMTYSRIKTKSELFDDSIVFEISCRFTCNKSWSKDKESAKLLSHEQLHFNISELITRKIRKGYLAHASKDIHKTAKILNDLYSKCVNDTLNSINNKYDTETAHGTIEKKQKEWDL